MIAYTGIETVSNLAEEARDPRAQHPALDPARRDRRLRDLLHAAADRAVGAAGAPGSAGDYVTQLGLAARPGRLQERPGARARREPRPARRGAARRAKIYVGVLAATILFIATNAGVIGASRITYSMASYRQLPEVFRRLHPRFKTPWLVARSSSPGSSRSSFMLPGQVDFLGDMYAFGAMLSFTVAHAAVIAAAPQAAATRSSSSARGRTCASAASTGRCSRSSAGSATGARLARRRRPEAAPTRYAGLGWLAAGFVFYAVYRRRLVHQPLTRDRRARRS